jgi:hypothetical protein
MLDDLGVVYRDRVLNPVVLLRLFLLQVLSRNIAITALRQFSGTDFAPSSYCQARQKLPLRFLRRLIHWTLQQAQQAVETHLAGPRLIVADCSTFSMADTPALRRRWGLPRGNGSQEGVAYPIGKFMALLDLASGCMIRWIPGPLYRHEASGLARLHRFIQPGDILLADRAFCSFAHIVMLNARGAFACFRLHQMRKDRAGISRWTRPAQCPKWMSRRQYEALPAELTVRIVRYRVHQKGSRSREIAIATTLRDERQWPDARIAELFGHRWCIETCFGDLKTTMTMCVLKCRTVAGVRRELLMYQLAYNLIRLTMLAAALERGVEAWRLSFVDTMRFLQVRLMGLPGVANLIRNPKRPGRYHPRVRRRRMKEYDLLTEPRHVRIAREINA